MSFSRERERQHLLLLSPGRASKLTHFHFSAWGVGAPRHLWIWATNLFEGPWLQVLSRYFNFPSSRWQSARFSMQPPVMWWRAGWANSNDECRTLRGPTFRQKEAPRLFLRFPLWASAHAQAFKLKLRFSYLDKCPRAESGLLLPFSQVSMSPLSPGFGLSVSLIDSAARWKFKAAILNILGSIFRYFNGRVSQLCSQPYS